MSQTWAMSATALGEFLRARRVQPRPEDVGLPPVRGCSLGDVCVAAGHIHRHDPRAGEGYSQILARDELDELTADAEATSPSQEHSELALPVPFAAKFVEVRVDEDLRPLGHLAMRHVIPKHGARMSTIHLNQTTTSTPEQFVAGLTDFGPGRSKLFGNSADEYLKVHSQGPGQADVTEGSVGIWERLHYDWSDPNRVIMTTTDSNVWGGGSGHTYTFTRQRNRTTDIDVVVVREGKNIKGRVLGVVLGTLGKRALGRELGKTVKAIEARNDGASATELT